MGESVRVSRWWKRELVQDGREGESEITGWESMREYRGWERESDSKGWERERERVERKKENLRERE